MYTIYTPPFVINKNYKDQKEKLEKHELFLSNKTEHG